MYNGGTHARYTGIGGILGNSPTRLHDREQSWHWKHGFLAEATLNETGPVAK